MPRPLRFAPPGVPLHIIQRGNDRSTTFRVASDFDRYLGILLDESRRAECAIHAYVVMSNHVHLLATPATRGAASRMMQAIGRRYVPYVNLRHFRTGALWEGRFKSSAITSERHLLVCSKYIELNPVRAGMVEGPLDYARSSYRANAYGHADALITPHALYTALGATPSARQFAYRALFESTMDTNTLFGIRQALRRGRALDGHVWQRSDVVAAR